MSRRDLPYIPSVFWLVFMVLPFAFQLPQLWGPAAFAQAVGIFCVALALLVGDFISSRLWGPRLYGTQIFGARPLPFAAAVGIFVLVGAQVVHLADMPEIPLVQEWVRMGDRGPDTRLLNELSRQVDQNREALKRGLEELERRRGISPDKAVSSYQGLLSQNLSSVQALLAKIESLKKHQSQEVLALSQERRALLDEYLTVLGSLRQNDIDVVQELRGYLNESPDPAVWTSSGLFKLAAVGRNDSGVSKKYEALMENLQMHELARLRERASKLLSVSPALIYFCQSALYLVPAILVALFARGRWGLGTLLLLFSLFYSRATLAKAPILIFVSLSMALGWQFASRNTRRLIAVPTLLVLSTFSIYTFYFFATDPLSIFRFRVPQWVQHENLKKIPDSGPHSRVGFTIGDHSRLVSKWRPLLPAYVKAENLSLLPRTLNFVAYRVFLTPAEVSNRWYAYFPNVPSGYLGWEGLTPASRNKPGFIHPATRVGRWAYVNRFPNNYHDTIRAYASADADAYARWGYVGIIACSFLILLLRVGLAWARQETIFSRSLYLTALFILGIDLPQGSIFATFVSQGLGLIFVFLLLLKLFRPAPETGTLALACQANV